MWALQNWLGWRLCVRSIVSDYLRVKFLPSKDGKVWLTSWGPSVSSMRWPKAVQTGLFLISYLVGRSYTEISGIIFNSGHHRSSQAGTTLEYLLSPEIVFPQFDVMVSQLLCFTSLGYHPATVSMVFPLSRHSVSSWICSLGAYHSYWTFQKTWSSLQPQESVLHGTLYYDIVCSSIPTQTACILFVYLVGWSIG